MREYRKQNAERMRELNRINYLKRKRDNKHIKQDYNALQHIQKRKQERMSKMSLQRKRRKKRLQELINSELLLS